MAMNINTAQDFTKMVGAGGLKDAGRTLNEGVMCAPFVSYMVLHPSFNIRIAHDDKELEMFDMDDICGVHFESSLEGSEGFSASIAFPFADETFYSLLEDVNHKAMERYYLSAEVKQLEMGL